MQRILQLLIKNRIIQSYEIMDYRINEKMEYIKIKVFFNNLSELIIRESISDNGRDYSYHWQKQNGDLILRWDNAPHHPKIVTFPHHKHAPDPQASDEIQLKEVLRYIETIFKQESV